MGIFLLEEKVERRNSWINDSGEAASCDRLTRPCVKRPSSFIQLFRLEGVVEGLNVQAPSDIFSLASG